MKYSEQLRSPKWQKKRLAIFERDNWTCQSCGSTDANLQVHHLKYIAGKKAWEHENCYLVTYCHICHETEHLIGPQIRGIFKEMIDENRIYIKPLAQINTLIEKFPAFYPMLKEFLNSCMIQYLRSKELEVANLQKN